MRATEEREKEKLKSAAKFYQIQEEAGIRWQELDCLLKFLGLSEQETKDRPFTELKLSSMWLIRVLNCMTSPNPK